MSDKLSTLMHHIRSINSSILYSSYEIQNIASNDAIPLAKRHEETRLYIKKIIAICELTSVRLKFYDYDTVNPEDQVEIDIEQAILTAIEIMRAVAGLKKVAIRYEPSQMVRVYGHEVIDIALCVILDNAIKYTFEYGAVFVFLEPDRIVVQSDGIAHEPDEYEAVLDGRRGARVVDYNIPGRGGGLKAARAMVAECYGGGISFEQRGPVRVVENREYRETIVTLALSSGQRPVARLE